MWMFYNILFILQNHYYTYYFQIFVKRFKEFIIGSSSPVAPQLIWFYASDLIVGLLLLTCKLHHNQKHPWEDFGILYPSSILCTLPAKYVKYGVKLRKKYCQEQ